MSYCGQNLIGEINLCLQSYSAECGLRIGFHTSLVPSLLFNKSATWKDEFSGSVTGTYSESYKLVARFLGVGEVDGSEAQNRRINRQ